MRAVVSFSFALMFSCSGAAVAQNARTCEAADVAAASRAHDRARLMRLLDSKGCMGVDQICTSHSLASAYVAEADVLAEGGKIDEARRVLDNGYHYGASWLLLSRRGDLAFERAVKGDKASYSRAAADYSRAINDIADTENVDCRSFGEPEASRDVIASLHKRMTEANLLAPTFEVATTRDGECGGVFLTEVRGFEPKATQLPIEFASNSTTLTNKGEQAAKALIECVRKFKSIRLSGHADQRGTDAYNMTLSGRRLETIKAMLEAGGFHGAIDLIPKGKNEPFKPDDPGKYSQDEIDQMNRRVELQAATP